MLSKNLFHYFVSKHVAIIVPQCECPSDGRSYAYDNCALLDPCTGHTCSNTSTCVSPSDWASNYTYTCSCIPGYTGDNCNIDIDECEGVICQNFGNCTDLIGGFQCLCVNGYEGTSDSFLSFRHSCRPRCLYIGLSCLVYNPFQLSEWIAWPQHVHC